MPNSRGSSAKACRAVGRAFASIIATGRMAALRQVSRDDKLTSSVPTITGRRNGTWFLR